MSSSLAKLSIFNFFIPSFSLKDICMSMYKKEKDQMAYMLVFFSKFILAVLLLLLLPL